METRASPRPLAVIAAALALTLAPSVAHAQTAAPAALSSASLAKSNAILGGSQSMLAEILAQQGGVSLPAQASVQYASLRRPAAYPSLVRLAPAISPGITSGRPDIFGTVALAVDRTPLDHRWRKVANARVGGSAANYASDLRRLDPMARIEAVNRFVNDRVQFVDDSRQFGRADYWMAASETLRRGRGDCEDYVIAKMQMLRAAGFADDDLYLVVVKDLVRRSDHAVLVVRSSGRMLVLDNGTDVILDTESVRDYRPVLTFAADGAWTHGYRRALPPVTIAAASLKPLAPAASAAPADQRSRSASFLAFMTGLSR